MKSFIKTISLLTTIVMIAITAIAYVCPMSFGHSVVVPVSQNMCNSTRTATGQVGCVNSHLATGAQFLADIPPTMNLLLALVLLFVTYRLVLYKFLTIISQPVFSRLKHRYLYYQTSIKLLVQERLLRYLYNLGNYTVVSFS